MSTEFSITRAGEPAGAFELHQDGRPVGRLDYRLAGPVLEIDYVVVDRQLRGQGLGVRLVDAAVAWARETGRTVRPFCGYAARVLRGTRYQDVAERGRS